MSEQVKRYTTNEAYANLPYAAKVVSETDYAALHAEAEALRVVLHEIASVNPAQRGIEWAKSYACDGLKGAGSELYARWLDSFNEAEALRAEIEEMDALLNRQADLLRQTAIALRGPEPDLTRYSHSDIPTRATTAVAELDALRAENAALRESSLDVRALAAFIYQACGAYDMPERILDALSAAANGEPFTHMIDGLLPCVPPSGEGVRALVEALEECAASLAWNCFGECRAIHAGPIMPAAMALDAARTALDAHRQAQRQA